MTAERSHSSGDGTRPKRGRGRPRKNPDQLARWTPPAGWVRVVAWVAPEERRALKRVAVESDASVAELVRSLANGLERGVVTAEELLKQFRKDNTTVEKIPTIFERDASFQVIDRVREGCEWVFGGEGTATEKLDGTNVRLTVRSGECVRIEKRRNPSKVQKQKGILNGWYVDVDESGSGDRWIVEAARNTDVESWPDGEHSCEALGPKIQGNPLGLESHLCAPFNLEIPAFDEVPRSFHGLRDALTKLESKYSPEHLAEGIVFHHPDGRRAKIKRRDFPAAS